MLITAAFIVGGYALVAWGYRSNRSWPRFLGYALWVTYGAFTIVGINELVSLGVPPKTIGRQLMNPVICVAICVVHHRRAKRKLEETKVTAS